MHNKTYGGKNKWNCGATWEPASARILYRVDEILLFEENNSLFLEVQKVTILGAHFCAKQPELNRWWSRLPQTCHFWCWKNIFFSFFLINLQFPRRQHIWWCPCLYSNETLLICLKGPGVYLGIGNVPAEKLAIKIQFYLKKLIFWYEVGFHVMWDF